MGVERTRSRAMNLKPFDGQPIRKSCGGGHALGTFPQKACGDPVWHGVSPRRGAFPLPKSVKGPVRAREARRQKGADGY
jgi:hypothetical protein